MVPDISIKHLTLPDGSVLNKVVHCNKFGACQSSYTDFDLLSPVSEKSEHVDGTRWAQSLIRSRVRVEELGLCNPWDWFATFTLDPQKYDRDDLSVFKTDFAQWVRDRKKTQGYEIKYLIVPERHKDGAWHMHGLISGVPDSELSLFVPDLHPKKLVDGGYYNWQRYADKFGFCSLGRVRSQEACARYTLKYLTKDLARSNSGFGANLYSASQGLNRALRTRIYGRCPDLENIATYGTEFARLGEVYASPDDLINVALRDNCEVQTQVGKNFFGVLGESDWDDIMTEDALCEMANDMEIVTCMNFTPMENWSQLAMIDHISAACI